MSNDVWSLAIILLNLATGRNPWKSASASDPTFQAYLQDPISFLPTVLPISPQLNAVLVRMLDVDWRHRMTLPELRRAMQGVDSFYSDGVVFEGSMARCPWEAGMDIDSDSSTQEESPCDLAKEQLKSHWSQDSSIESDMAYASQSPIDDLSYAEWAGYSSSAAAWGLDSPISSADSRLLEDLKMWESPRTPPPSHSPVSSSFGSLHSLPVTPNSTDTTFGDRVNIVPPKSLTLDTGCCRGHYRNGSMASFSTGSSIMQTAIDYDPYSSSFFLASSGPPSKISLERPTVDLVDDSDDDDDDAGHRGSKDMDTVSSWECAASDMSYLSRHTRTRSLLASQEIVNELKSAMSPCSETIVWPEFKAKQAFSPQLRQIPLPSAACPEPCDTLPQSDPSKKSHESKSKGASIFKFFPRSPRSSSSPSRGSTLSRSRTPSPQPKQPWTFAPTRARTPVPLNTQDADCQRTMRLVPKRHWFSPGKLFSTSAS